MTADRLPVIRHTLPLASTLTTDHVRSRVGHQSNPPNTQETVTVTVKQARTKGEAQSLSWRASPNEQ